MADREKKRKGVTRNISFQELAGEVLTYQPKRVRTREQIQDDDPYFRTLDAGHDLLMRARRSKELMTHLPKALGAVILELESIMKEMTLAAMEDEFDYRTQMNRYYHHMIRVGYLSSLLSFQAGRFVKDRTAVQKYLGDLPKERVSSFLKELAVFQGIGEELSTASMLFMDEMEKGDALAPGLLEERALSAQNMRRDLGGT